MGKIVLSVLTWKCEKLQPFYNIKQNIRASPETCVTLLNIELGYLIIYSAFLDVNMDEMVV